GIQAEVEDHFLGGGHHPAEVGVCRLGPRVVDDHLGRLLGRGTLPRLKVRVRPTGLLWFAHVGLPSRLLPTSTAKGSSRSRFKSIVGPPAAVRSRGPCRSSPDKQVSSPPVISRALAGRPPEAFWVG